MVVSLSRTVTARNVSVVFAFFAFFAFCFTFGASTAACSSFKGTPRPGDDGSDGGVTTGDDGGGSTTNPDGGTAGEKRCSHGTPFTSFEAIPSANGDINLVTEEQLGVRLTSNERVLYFYRPKNSNANSNIWRATRSDRKTLFGSPARIAFAGSDLERQGFPAEADTRLYFVSGATQFALYVSERTADKLTAPKWILTPDANESFSDPFVWRGSGSGSSVLFFAVLQGEALHLWSAPIDGNGVVGTRTQMAGVNDPTTRDSDPTLSSDGLALYFYSERGTTLGLGNIWLATRESTTAPWSSAVLVPIPRTGDYVAPGFLSEDNCRLYYYGPTTGSSRSVIQVASRSAQ